MRMLSEPGTLFGSGDPLVVPLSVIVLDNETAVSSLIATLSLHDALPISTSVPLPELIARALAVSVLLSTSDALPRSWAWVMTRTPLSSAIAAKVGRAHV